MAETRKHQSLAKDPLARAVRAAIGDDVRPAEPGAKPASAAPTEPERGAKPTSSAPTEPPTKGSTLPRATLGSFTFGPAAKPVRPPEDDDAR